jgi:hypothetical protein
MKHNFRVLTLLLIGATAPLCHAQSIKNLLPDYTSTQYAGSTGWMSVGAAYNLFKHRARVGFHYGFVPEKKGGKLHILSTSLFFKPYMLHASNKIDINPLDIGVKASYHFGDQFFMNLPSKYPDGYYWWKSALRLHLATETSVTYRLKNAGRIKSVTGFLELNSNDLYLVSYVLNFKSLSLSDIIKAGVGLRIGF